MSKIQPGVTNIIEKNQENPKTKNIKFESINLPSHKMQARYMTKNKKKYYCNKQEKEGRKMENKQENAKTKKRKEICLLMVAFFVLAFSGNIFPLFFLHSL